MTPSSPNSPNTIFLSIIVPAHNEAKYIQRTLDALNDCCRELKLAASTQRTDVPVIQYELIVVNDDSTDATKTIAENSGARVIDVTLRNIGAVRNAGAAAAQGDWLLFVDADTVVPVPTFRRMISLMHQGVAGGGAIADIDDKPNVPWLKFLMYVGVSVAWQRLGRLAAGCFMFCRRDLFLGFGGFNEDFFAAEEFFFSRAVKRRGRFVLMSQPVLTSSRKLKSYSTTELFRFVSSFLFRGSSALKSRQSLDVLYEGRR